MCLDASQIKKPKASRLLGRIAAIAEICGVMTVENTFGCRQLSEIEVATEIHLQQDRVVRSQGDIPGLVRIPANTGAAASTISTTCSQ